MSKKQNKTTQEEQKDTFCWLPDTTSKWLPIDPSINELKKQHNWPNRAVTQHLIQNPIIKETLHKFLAPDEEMDKRPLPLEAKTFLECFFSMRDRPEYSPLFRSYTIRSKPEVDMDQFITNFCHALHNRISLPISNDTTDPNAYCRHVLFENDTFVSKTLTDVWETQISRRLTAIHSLLTGSNPSLQMNVLSECLLALDQCIARFSAAPPTAPTSSDPGTLISSMLEQLLSARKEMQIKIHDQTLYRIKNTSFPAPSENGSPTEDNLEHAFSAINNRFHKPSNEYIEAARICYLQNLAKTRKSDTEQIYQQLNDYLSCIDNSSDFQDLLIEWTDAWCKETINSCFSQDISEEKPEFDFSDKGYIGAMATQLISVQMSTSLKLFENVFNAIRMFQAVQAFYSLENVKEETRQFLLNRCDNRLCAQINQSLTSHFAQEEHELCWNFANNFIPHLSSAWLVLFDTEPDFYLDARQVHPTRFAEKFCPAAKAAAEHFEQTNEWISETIISHLNTYNKVITHSDHTVPLCAVLNGNLCILKGLALMILQRIQKNCVQNALTALSFISEKLS